MNIIKLIFCHNVRLYLLLIMLGIAFIIIFETFIYHLDPGHISSLFNALLKFICFNYPV